MSDAVRLLVVASLSTGISWSRKSVSEGARIIYGSHLMSDIGSKPSRWFDGEPRTWSTAES